MASQEQASGLQFYNRGTVDVRLRFRCGGQPAWDAWIGAGARLRVPPPRWSALSATLHWLDPDTGVSHQLAPQVCGAGTRLAATRHIVAGAARLSCEAGAGVDRQALLLENHTRAELTVALALANTPFAWPLRVAAGGGASVRAGDIDFVVTLNGTSSAARTVATWDGVVTIDMAEVHGNQVPLIGYAGDGSIHINARGNLS